MQSSFRNIKVYYNRVTTHVPCKSCTATPGWHRNSRRTRLGMRWYPRSATEWETIGYCNRMMCRTRRCWPAVWHRRRWRQCWAAGNGWVQITFNYNFGTTFVLWKHCRAIHIIGKRHVRPLTDIALRCSILFVLPWSTNWRQTGSTLSSTIRNSEPFW